MNKKVIIIIYCILFAAVICFIMIISNNNANDKAYDEIKARKEKARIDAATNVGLYLAMFRDCGYVSLKGDNIEGIRATTISVYVNSKINDCKGNIEFMENLRQLCLGLNFRKGDKFRVIDSSSEKEIITFDVQNGLKLIEGN